MNFFSRGQHENGFEGRYQRKIYESKSTSKAVDSWYNVLVNFHWVIGEDIRLKKCFQ